MKSDKKKFKPKKTVIKRYKTAMEIAYEKAKKSRKQKQ